MAKTCIRLLLAITGFAAHVDALRIEKRQFDNSSTITSMVTAPQPSASIDLSGLTTRCGMSIPVEIPLNSWYTRLYGLTVATVTTNWIQYNNTVIPANSTTNQGVVMAYSSTRNITFSGSVWGGGLTSALFVGVPLSLPGLPTDLVYSPSGAYNVYAWTSFVTNPAFTGTAALTTEIASPTPYMIIETPVVIVEYYNFTKLVTASVPDLGLSAPLLGPVTGPVDWSYMMTFTSEPPEVASWISEAGLLSKFPFLSDCPMSGNASGAPTVHVHVTELTATSHVTSTVAGNYGTSRAPTLAPTTPATTGQTFSKQPTSAEVPLPSPQKTSGQLPTSTPGISSTAEPINTGVSTSGIPIEQNSPTSDSSRAPDSTNPGASPTEGEGQPVTNGGTPGTSQASQKQATSALPQTTGRDISDTRATSGPSIGTSLGAQTGAVTTTQTPDEGKSSEPTYIAPTLTFGTSVATPDSKTQYHIGTQTLSPGGSGVVLSGTTYALSPSPSAIIINGETSSFVQTAGSIAIGSHIATPAASSALVIGEETLVPGSAVTISGTTYSLPSTPTAIIINGKASPLPSAPAAQVVTPMAISAFLIAGQTLAPGSAITVEGTTYSLPINGASIYINNSPSSLPSSVAGAVTFGGGELATPVSFTAFLIGGQTLIPGGPALTLQGTTYSLPASPTNILINGQSSPIPAPTAVDTREVLYLGSLKAKPLPSSLGYLIASQTLLPGGPVLTIKGTTYSLAPSATEIFINGQPSLIPTPTGTSAEVIYFGTLAVTPLASASEYLIAGQTLVPGGPAITVGGTTYSLPIPSSSPSLFGGEVMVINGVTSTLHAPTATAAEAEAEGEMVIASQTLHFSPITATATAGTGTETEGGGGGGEEGVLIASQTLLPSHSITVLGEILSLVSGTPVSVGSAAAVQSHQAAGDAVAGAILSALGGMEELSSPSAASNTASNDGRVSGMGSATVTSPTSSLSGGSGGSGGGAVGSGSAAGVATSTGAAAAVAVSTGSPIGGVIALIAAVAWL